MTPYAAWQDLREVVRATVETDLRLGFPALRLKPIDHAALTAAKPWREAQRIGWEWRSVLMLTTNRFDLAVWHDGMLCGLAYGPATADRIAIAYLQGNPDPTHPLKGYVIDIAVAALEAQALAADAAEMRLPRQLPELVRVYGERGYLPVAGQPDPAYLRKTRMPSRPSAEARIRVGAVPRPRWLRAGLPHVLRSPM